MGREIRKVPPYWVQPKRADGQNQPMYDQNYEDALAEWLSYFDRIRKGEEKEFYPKGLRDWLMEYKAPNPEYYRPWKDEEATWLQVWENVSEGTPVTPPFATKEELIDYLVNNGDFWDQIRGHGGWKKTSAEQFVSREFAPSLIVVGGEVFTPRDGEPRVQPVHEIE